MKRWREPKAKVGELLARWGKVPHEKPGICYAANGGGVQSGDMHLLHDALCGPRTRLNLDGPIHSKLDMVVYDPSFTEELERRGYDLTTLRFSIQKKQVGQ